MNKNNPIESIPLMISKNNLEYRLEEFKNGKIDKLFITGLSGAGKSTLAKKLAKECGVPLICLDGYMKRLVKQTKVREFIDKTTVKELYYTYGLDLLIKHHPERCIVEGGQLLYFDINEIKTKYSLVVIRTSLIKSICRACKRNFESKHRDKYKHINPYRQIRTNFEWYNHITNLNK